MNILITGGAGYIGGALTDILIENSEHEVRVYDTLLYEKEYRKSCQFVLADVCDYKKLQPHLDWADAVVWLAALVGDGACAIDPQLSKQINQDAVEYLAENFSGRIVYMSTCSVYGAADKILDEQSTYNPLSVYAVTKLNSEKYLENKNAIWFRLGTLHGISDSFARIRLDLVLNLMTLNAHHQGKLSVFGGEQYRPLLHVRDVAIEAHRQITGTQTGCYNLAHANMKIIDLANRVKDHFPNIEMQITDMPFQDTRNYQVNCDKAKNELDFNPSLTIDESIEELKELFASNRIKDIHHRRYSNAKYLASLLNQR